ncbi:sensor histidine kinase [Microbacterium sp. CH12i]|uniref:sensor histidine kinase n=1 Tax=Microbacterium sp. CH12i TaxID=1479651 RepID=UPI002E142008
MYSPSGSRVAIGVKTEGDVVEIAVSDQGIGIAESDRDRIFERFYRADEARSRRTGGTGLGLSIVKHATQRHGGEVRLWSRPSRGSTFTMVLPRIDAPAHEEVVPKKKKKKKRERKAAKAAVAEHVRNGENA